MSANAIETLRGWGPGPFTEDWNPEGTAAFREALAAVKALLDATDVPLFLECITNPRCGDCPGCRLDAARRRVEAGQ